MEEQIINTEPQFTPKFLLLTDEDYKVWNEKFGSWDNIPDPKGGTLRYASDNPDKDINGLSILPVTAEKQRQAEERGEVLPEMVDSVVKATVNEGDMTDNQTL